MHEEGSEYWLQFFAFPSDVTITEFDTVGKIAYTIVKLKYLVDEKINRKQYQWPNCNNEVLYKVCISRIGQ